MKGLDALIPVCYLCAEYLYMAVGLRKNGQDEKMGFNWEQFHHHEVLMKVCFGGCLIVTSANYDYFPKSSRGEVVDVHNT